jgi:hypothetical protein
MDGPCATTPNPASASDACPTYSFRSPPRILIPKLCRSRDAWKAKAQLRGSQLKTLQVRVHDVCLSRDSWRQRAEDAHQQVHQLQGQVQQLQQQLADAQQQLSSLEQGEKRRAGGDDAELPAGLLPLLPAYEHDQGADEILAPAADVVLRRHPLLALPPVPNLTHCIASVEI